MGHTYRQQNTLGKYCTAQLAEAGHTRQTNKLADIRSFKAKRYTCRHQVILLKWSTLAGSRSHDK
jgi:hypothetical protein